MIETRTFHWHHAAAVVVIAAACAAGCAPLPPPGTATAPPVSGHDTSAPRPPGSKPTMAVIDSTPSSDADRVLASIAEPLTPEQRVPPPDIPVPATPAASTGSGAGSSSGSQGVPVPAPTPVLGEHTNQALLAPDTSAADTTKHSSGMSHAPSKPAPTSPGAAGAPPPGAAPGPCWRLQVNAPLDQAEAEAKRSAAESVLLVRMVVEPESGRWKVRSRDCFDRATADRTRERALASGFDGAFLVEGAKK